MLKRALFLSSVIVATACGARSSNSNVAADSSAANAAGQTTATASSAGLVSKYACKTGIDEMNEAPATFTLDPYDSFHKTVLDEKNRIWSYCTLYTIHWTKIQCIIGQLPADLPADAQNIENLVPATNGLADLGASLFVETGSYAALKDASHVNYLPYIDCEKQQ